MKGHTATADIADADVRCGRPVEATDAADVPVATVPPTCAGLYIDTTTSVVVGGGTGSEWDRERGLSARRVDEEGERGCYYTDAERGKLGDGEHGGDGARNGLSGGTRGHQL